MTDPRDLRRGLLFLLVTMTTWGLNWPVMKHLLTEMPPFLLRGVSGFAAAGLAFAIAAHQRERLLPPPGQWRRLIVYALLNLTAWAGFTILALGWLPASEAAIISYATPVWTALLAWPLLGERPGLARTGGLALAFSGVGALVWGRPLAASMDKLPGIGAMLAATFLFSIGTVVTKRRPVGLSPLVFMAWQVGLGTVPLALIAVAFEPLDAFPVTPIGWGCLLYLSFVAVCLAYVCWFRALRLLPATIVAMGILLVPVLGVLSSAAALGEPLGARQAMALTLTLAGVLIATRA